MTSDKDGTIPLRMVGQRTSPSVGCGPVIVVKFPDGAIRTVR